MKVWVIVTKSGRRYPMNTVYVNEEQAREVLEVINEHDSGYAKARGGLFLETVETSRALVKSFGFDIVDGDDIDYRENP